MVTQNSIGVTLVARAAYYDRNPTVFSKQLGISAAAPHAITTRWSYTAPTGRKALLGGGVAQVNRATAATTVGVLLAQVADTSANVLQAFFNDNTVGHSIVSIGLIGGLVLAGQTITGADEDLSTGGTGDFSTSVNILEFDA